LWDSTTVQISLDGVRVKTVRSRLNIADLARLRAYGMKNRTTGWGTPPVDRRRNRLMRTVGRFC
jgi:hypothetical protein